MSTKLRFALLVAVLATSLSCIACGGASGGVDDDPSYNADTLGNGDGTGDDAQANEVAEGDETTLSCPSGMTFKAGSNPPCVVTVGPCQPDDPSWEGKTCAGDPPCIVTWDKTTCGWQCGSGPDGRVPPIYFVNQTKEDLAWQCP